MASNEFGILIQGKVSSWTNDIVNEYKKNFPDAEIVFVPSAQELNPPAPPVPPPAVPAAPAAPTVIVEVPIEETSKNFLA